MNASVLGHELGTAQALGAYGGKGNNLLPPELWLLPCSLPIHPGNGLLLQALMYVALVSLIAGCVNNVFRIDTWQPPSIIKTDQNLIVRLPQDECIAMSA